MTIWASMYLIDTLVIIWQTDDEERLGPGTRKRLVSCHPVYFSSISVVEIVMKAMTGKLRAPDGLGGLLEAQGLRPLPLTSEHARAVEQFPELAGHDPFNRMLVAQARSEGLTFLTADRRLLSLGYDWIDDATE